MSEILIYGDIYSNSASKFIGEIQENEDDSITVRINSDGGDPHMGWGMAARFAEFEGEKIVKIDGKAYSAAAFFALYAENCEALDVSEFLIHRAAYDSWMESSEYFTTELRANLERINKSLKDAFVAKIDVAKFEKIAKYTVDEVFSMDSRIDVFLNAKQALEIGLISSIKKLTPAKKQQIDARFIKIAAKYTGVSQEQKTAPSSVDEVPINKKQMTIEQLKSEHPDLVAKLQNDAVNNERSRVAAFMVFNDIAPKEVAEGIKAGFDMTQAQSMEFMRKEFGKGVVATLENETVDAVTTTEPETVETDAVSKLTASVNAHLGIK
jgi:ATP-dependent protease ClpP protease subunit